MVVGLALAGGAALIIGMAMLGFGTFLYVRVADREKPEGCLWGTLRAVPRRAEAQALPWDVCGAVLVLWAAFGG